MTTKKRNYPAEFKQEAVQMQRKNLTAIAKEVHDA
jgi:transposase-like protein